MDIYSNIYTHIQITYKAERVFMTRSFLSHIQNKSFHDGIISLVRNGRFYNKRCHFTFNTNQ